MKRIIIIFSFICFKAQAQEIIEFKPDYPLNFKDTLVVYGGDSPLKKQISKRTISFTVKDINWNCKKNYFCTLFT